MEVIVRNLHDQATEKQVDAFFRIVLEKLEIKTYLCQKLKGRGIATITILDIQKARQFLSIHGQTELGPRAWVKLKLMMMGRPIHCSLSNKAPDPYMLLSLRKEEKDRYAASQSKRPRIVQGREQEASRPGESRRTFDIISLKCGQWTYVGDDLAFATYSHEKRDGRIVFARRNLLITLHPEAANLPSHQIEIPYGSIQSFTIGPKSNPSITFSLAEAPKLYETLIENSSGPNSSILEDAMKLLMLRQSIQILTRKRITSLSKAHEKVVPSCLCYRIMLSNAGEIARVQALRRFPEIPNSILFATSAIMNTDFLFAAQMTELDSTLTGTRYGQMSFDVKFQMLRLARNGILAPSKVVELLVVVTDQLKSKDAAIVAQSVRNLCDQIPYAGPDTEASELSMRALSEFLVQNQESIVRGESYSNGLAEQYDHIGSVHKVTVTPAGTYLYGPDPEVKNRVLRKYSAYPNHFLSVSFLDEDGETLRLDRQTSGELIYQGRFKAVLEGVIIIAGREYEVCSSLL